MPQTLNIPERLPISINPDKLANLCRRYGIRALAIFGSVMRNDFTSQSDARNNNIIRMEYVVESFPLHKNCGVT